MNSTTLKTVLRAVKSIFTFAFIFTVAAHAAPMSLDELLASPSNPLFLQASLNGKSSSRLITKQNGGQIFLLAQDGSEFTLTFPAGSVPYDMNITMSETKDLKINGLAFQSFGVQLFPNGLELIQPALLKIKTTRVLNPKKLSLITSQNDGTVAHVPYLRGVNVQSVELLLFHFSNYAATDEQKVQEIIDLGMADTEAVRINNWFNRQILNLKTDLPNEALSKIYRDGLKEAVKKVVIPKLQYASTCQGGTEALSSYFLIARQAGLFGITMDEVLEADGVQAFRDARAVTSSLCLKEARQFCNVDHNIPAALKIWLTLNRFAGLLGDDELLDAVDDSSQKCMKFKFFMQTDFKMGEGQEFNGLVAVSEFDFNFTMGGTIVSAAGFLNANGTTEPIHDFQKGDISIVDTYLNLDSLICSRTSMLATPGPIQVDNFIGDLLAGRKPVLRITDPNPEVTAQFFCRDKEDPENSFTFELPPGSSEKYFLGLFHATHGPTGLNEMNKEGHFDLKNAVFKNGSKYIEAVYNHVVEDVIHEVTTVVVTHIPE